MANRPVGGLAAAVPGQFRAWFWVSSLLAHHTPCVYRRVPHQTSFPVRTVALQSGCNLCGWHIPGERHPPVWAPLPTTPPAPHSCAAYPPASPAGRLCSIPTVPLAERQVQTTRYSSSFLPKTAQYLAQSNCILAQGRFQLQFPQAWFSSSPSHLAVVGERYHAFRFQTT